MTPDLQRRIQRYGWDKAADEYETGWMRQLAPVQERLLQQASLQPFERVLDVACGTGLVTFPAAERVGPGGSVLAVDLSDRMVERVRAEGLRRKMGQVRAEHMDAEVLKVPDTSFDAALCGLGLMYVPDPLQALREARRVLRPGGRFVASVWGRRERCGWKGIFEIVDARVRTEVCPLFFQLGMGTALAEVAREAGFTHVVTERLETVLVYASDEEALNAAFLGSPAASAYSRFDDRVRGEAQAEYLKSIAPFRSGTGYEIPGEFVVVRGVNAERPDTASSRARAGRRMRTAPKTPG